MESDTRLFHNFVQNLKRLVWKVDTQYGMLGIMEKVIHQQHVSPPISDRKYPNWPTFLRYHRWCVKPTIETLGDLEVHQFTLANLFGIPEHNWNLSISSLSSHDGKIVCHLRSMSADVLAWVHNILLEIQSKYVSYLQSIVVSTKSRPIALVVTMTRWIPPSRPETLWSFWDRFSDNGEWNRESVWDTKITLTNQGSVNVLLPTQLLQDLYSSPTHNIQETIAYCRRRLYDKITYHLDQCLVVQADQVTLAWKRDRLWARYRLIIVWCWLHQQGRLSWNHRSEEGTFGLSWMVERLFCLPTELQRQVIKWF
jgi:hypothetical protein